MKPARNTPSFSRLLCGILLTTGAAIGLSACNTVSGAGQDVSAIGHNVTHGADATQGSIQRNTGAATR